MRQFGKIIISLSFILLARQVLAIDLVGSYQQALVSDPTFQSARAQWFADREQISISRAGLLPSFDVNAQAGRYTVGNTNNEPALNAVPHYYNNRGLYSLTLDQPIFNYNAWASLKQAKSTVKSSAATFAAAAQDLIYRTSTAYLDVLRAADQLRYTQAEKRALASQLERARERFKVGLETITYVEQAQASYDTQVALEITDQNNLAIQKEKLREITGQYYKSYAKLTRELPLVTPRPAEINQWVIKAQQQNYDLLAARYNLQAAQENIKVQSSQRYPRLDVAGQLGQQYDSRINGFPANNTATTGVIGFNLDFPVVHGGLFSAQTRQAEYLYQKAGSDLDFTDRGTVSNTRQAYLGVIAGISNIKANRQAVISSKSSLASTEEQYKVGTATMIDVLDQLSALYDNERAYANSQYDYLEQTLLLKQQAGILSVADIEIINSWLQPAAPVAKKPVIRKTRPKYHTRPVPRKTTHKKTCRKATASEKQLLNINPKHYTIQLIATQDSKYIVNFINKYPIPAKAYIFSSYQNGHKIYKLIAGDYSTYHHAHTALNKLPHQIKSQHPWIRSYGSVQRAIKQGLCS